MTQHHRKRVGRRSGFTLIETLLASALFALGIAAISQGMAHGTRIALKARLQVQSALRCQATMDELKYKISNGAKYEVKFMEVDEEWEVSSVVVATDFEGIQLVTIQTCNRAAPDLSSFELTGYVRANSN